MCLKRIRSVDVPPPPPWSELKEHLRIYIPNFLHNRSSFFVCFQRERILLYMDHGRESIWPSMELSLNALPPQESMINTLQMFYSRSMPRFLQLGGLNSLLAVEYNPSIPVVSKAPTFILGMDVSHGSPGQSDVPSIVGGNSFCYHTTEFG